MNNIVIKYLQEMASFADCISQTITLTNKYWYPQTTPVVILFAQIGKAIAGNFCHLDESQKKAIFKHIEEGMDSLNDELATAVATGLIEAIVTKADNNFLLSKELDVFWGEKSKLHALAWQNFGHE